MSDKPPKIEDEPGAKERFERGIENALKTPPQPRAPAKGDASPKPPRKNATS